MAKLRLEDFPAFLNLYDNFNEYFEKISSLIEIAAYIKFSEIKENTIYHYFWTINDLLKHFKETFDNGWKNLQEEIIKTTLFS